MSKLSHSSDILVSIHAPVKGATGNATRDGWAGSGFNPRAREGRDKFFSAIVEILFPFQSTRP